MFKTVSAIAVVVLAVGACGAGVPGPTAKPSPSPAISVAPGPTDEAESPSPAVPSIDPFLPTPDSVDLAGTCTEGSSLCTTMDIATWRSIPFTPDVACSNLGTKCQVVANIYGPTHPGNWPLFVLVSGADDYETPDAADSAYIDDFARQLAGHGAVVMRANWRRGPGQGAGCPSSFADIGCAIGVSRAIGASYGADPSHVVLVGHSSGGWATAIVGLTATPFTPAAGSCNETAGSLRPDAWAGMAPALDHATDSFMGGSKVELPEAWAAVDAFALADGSTATDRLPVTLIVGGVDEVAPSTHQFEDALLADGIDSVLLDEPGQTHPSILSTVESIEALFELAARL